ncbi:MAG: leucine-rich repeat domain-containing protein [Promethearchaeota archaeon]
MSTIRKCERCGIQNNEYVRFTATCKKCGKSFLICNNCKSSWQSQKCPSCGGWISGGTWNFSEIGGSGSSSSVETPTVFINHQAYVEDWNAAKEQLDKKRLEEGDSTHMGVELAPEEVAFIRELEDAIHQLILAKEDEDENYVTIDDGHVTKLRIRNTDLETGFPESISKLDNLKEFRYERTDKYKKRLKSLPESISQCKNLETVVLRGCENTININILSGLDKLKYLSVRGVFRGRDDDTVSDVFSLSNLEELNMSYCTVKEELLEGLKNLTKLKKLNIAGMMAPRSRIYSLPESIKNLKELEELNVRGTGIGTNFPGKPWPDWILTLPKLRIVHIIHEQLLNNGTPLFHALYEKYQDIYDVPEITQEMKQKFAQSDWNAWFDENKSETLKAGWSGVE